jgi:Zn-dependent protease with chaperone function
MAFVRTWLMPRAAFWLIWTAWLWCLQWFLLARLEALPGHGALLYIVGPPVLIARIGSKLVKNPLDSPDALFWKGAALSCLLAAYANMFLMKEMGWGPHFLIGAALICGYLGLRGPGLKKMAITQGELFDRAQFIAGRSGVTLRRVVVFKSPRDLPTAFAHRNTGAILLSERLLCLLSRRETEAVIAHEAAHLRPLQRLVVSAVPLLVALTILLGSFWPEAKAWTPFVPILAVLLWRALRRMQEYDADSNAVRATGDPEALIAALTRISGAAGMPLHWGAAAGLLLPHPPMTARFRSIARKGGIASARVEEIVSAAGVVPPLPGFSSPFGQSQSPDGGILSVHRERLTKRMMLLSKLFPILAGAAFTAAERALAPDAVTLIAHTLAWSAGAMVIFWIAYEIMVGWERRGLRGQLPDAHRQGGYFAGVSTAAEPRYYEGLYHYDLGLARIDGGSLRFAGTRCSFSLGSSEARRVWLASGPRHWTPRKIVSVAYQLDGGKTGIVSLQSLERWFWPGTSAAAQELFAALTQWSKNGEPPGAPTSPPPQISGAVVPRVGLSAVWKSMKVPCLVSLCVGWFIVQIPSLEPEGFLTPFAAPLVTGALLLFILAPHVEWSHVRSVESPSAQPSAYPEAE